MATDWLGESPATPLPSSLDMGERGVVVQAVVPESPCLDDAAARGDGGWLP